MEIPTKLNMILGEQEEIQFIDQLSEKVYKRKLYLAIAFVLAWLIIIDGYFFAYGSLFKEDFFPSLFGLLFLNFPFFMGIFSIIRIQKRYPNSFYAYSNSRFFYSNLTSVKEMDFVQIRDIQKTKAKNSAIVLEIKDSQSKFAKRVLVSGVKDPEALKRKLDQEANEVF